EHQAYRCLNDEQRRTHVAGQSGADGYDRVAAADGVGLVLPLDGLCDSMQVGLGLGQRDGRLQPTDRLEISNITVRCRVLSIAAVEWRWRDGPAREQPQ